MIGILLGCLPSEAVGEGKPQLVDMGLNSLTNICSLSRSSALRVTRIWNLLSGKCEERLRKTVLVHSQARLWRGTLRSWLLALCSGKGQVLTFTTIYDTQHWVAQGTPSVTAHINLMLFIERCFYTACGCT